MQPLQLISTRDVHLQARQYAPDATPLAAVLIAPAMGVNQDYYADFAAWLAREGYLVLTFDYRGMGASRPAERQRSLRGFDADHGTDFAVSIETG